jgi:hypothetical protein
MHVSLLLEQYSTSSLRAKVSCWDNACDSGCHYVYVCSALECEVEMERTILVSGRVLFVCQVETPKSALPAT